MGFYELIDEKLSAAAECLVNVKLGIDQWSFERGRLNSVFNYDPGDAIDPVSTQTSLNSASSIVDELMITFRAFYEQNDNNDLSAESSPGELSKHDNVEHPSHYQSSNGLEVIDVIESFTEGLSGAEATHTGNVLKYMCRWKHKNGLEDLKKARWYLNRLIDIMEKE
jgi:hypothetical protein